MSRQNRTEVAGEPVSGEALEPPYIQHRTRRDYPRWFKLQVVRECLVPGASVSAVARRHNINTNVIFRWRADFKRGDLKAPAATTPPPTTTPDGFIPVGVIGKDGRLVKEPVAPKMATTVPATVPARPAQSYGAIELEISGHIKIRFEVGVDKETLRRVLAVAREFA